MKDIRYVTLHGTFLQVEFDYHRYRRCNKCGRKIWLAQATSGKFIPIEEKKFDDSEEKKFVVHFLECQKAREAEKINK